jgi:hypothetical protein
VSVAAAENSRYAKRSHVAALVMALAIAVITVLIAGGVATTLAMLARCGENIPPERLDGCRWLEHEDGWVRLPLYASALPVLACFVAYWKRSAWVVPIATLLALVIAVPTPFLVAS